MGYVDGLTEKNIYICGEVDFLYESFEVPGPRLDAKAVFLVPESLRGAGGGLPLQMIVFERPLVRGHWLMKHRYRGTKAA